MLENGKQSGQSEGGCAAESREEETSNSKVSGTNIEKLQGFSMPRVTQPWSSNLMLHMQFKWKDCTGNMN